MKRTGIIGWPLEYTLSPIFQQKALDYLELPVSFEQIKLEPKQISTFAQKLRGEDWLGVCVTIPYKERISELVDNKSEAAETIGASNFVVNSNGTLTGHNTDTEGFLVGLRQLTGNALVGKKALVIGAGGAARAVVYALREYGLGQVIVANRNPQRAQVITDLFSRAGFMCSAIPLEENTVTKIASQSSLVINASSIGMKGTSGAGQSPVPRHALSSLTTCYDIVYTPRITPFLQEARMAGATTIDGLSMLVNQGAIGFTLLTGQPAPIDVMWSAIEEALGDPA